MPSSTHRLSSCLSTRNASSCEDRVGQQRSTWKRRAAHIVLDNVPDAVDGALDVPHLLERLLDLLRSAVTRELARACTLVERGVKVPVEPLLDLVVVRLVELLDRELRERRWGRFGGSRRVGSVAPTRVDEHVCGRGQSALFGEEPKTGRTSILRLWEAAKERLRSAFVSVAQEKARNAHIAALVASEALGRPFLRRDGRFVLIVCGWAVEVVYRGHGFVVKEEPLALAALSLSVNDFLPRRRPNGTHLSS